jgi:hypothetical protein
VNCVFTVNAHCLRFPPPAVLRQNLITIDIVDFLQPSATLYWYEGITILVTEHPTADWTAQQIIEAFPEETAPRFLLRDRDQICGEEFSRRVAGMGIEEVMTARILMKSLKIQARRGFAKRSVIAKIVVIHAVKSVLARARYERDPRVGRAPKFRHS